MIIILESANPEKVIIYAGRAINALFKKTKYSVLPYYTVEYRRYIVRYIDRDAGKVVSLHMSKFAHSEAYQASMLSDALHNGTQNDETYQIEKITSTSVPVDENGLPGIAGEGLSM